MTPEQYAFDAVVLDMTPEGYEKVRERASMRLLHAATGIAGESGEIVDLIKKHTFGGKPLDRDKVREECGDLLWYFHLLLEDAGLTLEEVMKVNIAKLTTRYVPGMRDQKYQGRDEAAEKKAMEEALGEDCLDSPNEWGPITQRDIRPVVRVSGPPMMEDWYERAILENGWEDKAFVGDNPGWLNIEVGVDPDDQDPPEEDPVEELTRVTEDLGLYEYEDKSRYAYGEVIDYNPFSGWGEIQEEGEPRRWRFFGGVYVDPRPPKVGGRVTFSVYKGYVTSVREL